MVKRCNLTSGSRGRNQRRCACWPAPLNAGVRLDRDAIAVRTNYVLIDFENVQPVSLRI